MENVIRCYDLQSMQSTRDKSQWHYKMIDSQFEFQISIYLFNIGVIVTGETTYKKNITEIQL